MWRPTTSEVSPDSFDEAVSNHRLVVLHFWAAWNEYDKQMDADLEEVESEYKNRVFFWINRHGPSWHWQRCRELGILNLPAIACFANGKHMQTVIGMRSKQELSKKIKEWIMAARV